MDFFYNAADQIEDFVKLRKYLEKNNAQPEGKRLPALVTGVSHIHKAHFLCALIREYPGSLIIAESEGEAQRLCSDINAMNGGETALLYPARELVLGNYEAASKEYEHKRIYALSSLLDGKCGAVVCSAEAAAQLTIPPEELKKRTVTLEAGGECSQEELVARLISAGYSRTDMIGGAGQFSVRGGIVDIFPPSSPAPCRVEFWGDSVDGISRFDTETQRRTEGLDKIDISPASETLFDSAEELCGKIEELAGKLRGKKAEDIRGSLMSDVKKMRGGITLRSVDRYFPLCYGGETTVFDYTDKVFICENSTLKESFRAVSLQHSEDLKILVDECRICKGLDRFMLSKGELYSLIETRAMVYFDTFVRGGGLELGTIINVRRAVQTSPWGGEYKLLEEELDRYLSEGFGCLVFAGTEKGARNLTADLRDDGFLADYTEDPEKPVEKRVLVTAGTISAGFEYFEDKLAVFTHTAVHAERRSAVKKKKKGEEIRSLTDISIGDLVVHQSHGIGIFDGVHKIETDGVSKDYIRIKYAGADVLHVPVTQLDLVSRYIGSGDVSTVKLNKLNSEQWQKTKSRAKAAAKEMASELIELYSKRMRAQGYQFPEDDSMQEDFEQHFSYVETDSQLRCIDEIKADMQSPHPMERLLCGDVGFGKTEVAVRAAFKAACDSKQVAVLVPTTVLAYQHYQTFAGRLKNFPVRVEYLSRARSAKKTREVLADLEAGRIDIIIGTHKLIGKAVKFKDLGLLIIDEEQKFGVATKEKLRKMKTNVDTLTMSATPIPRTLQFSLMGARDMSIIQTPPPNRYPICTEVHTFDKDVICDAINFEMSRNGQVFFVNDRISSLPELAALVNKYIPDARVAIGHGQMKPEELEKVIMGFINYDYDVLISTTIVENGVDISNANTIIINDAHRFGLSALHQMRGRVGRSNKKAFCYLLSPPKAGLTQEARRRLEALETFSELGSGFNLSMQDLDIRGAGNLLGAEQSGFMEDLGYETYQKILNQAVTELKNEEFGDMYGGETEGGIQLTGNDFVEDCAVESDLEMYFPDSYVPGSSERMMLYRELENISNDEELEKFRQNMNDRFGEMPHEGLELLNIVPLRRLGRHIGCEKIILKQGRMQMQFVSNPMSPYYKSSVFGNVINYVAANTRRCTLKEIKGKRSMVVSGVATVGQAVDVLRGME